jgi:gluconolactonase
VFRQPSGQANGNTRDREGRLITCEHKNRRVSRTEKDGRVVTLAERFEGKRLNSPNDVVVKSDGSIYFTDPPYGIGREQEELGFYGVYRLTADGTLTLLVRDFVRPNGLAFSPDESKLYVDDSQEGPHPVFDVRKDGTLANGRVFAELKAPGKRGVPDGMKVDTRGNVYCTGPEGVWVFDKSGTSRGRSSGRRSRPTSPSAIATTRPCTSPRRPACTASVSRSPASAPPGRRGSRRPDSPGS